MRSLVIRCFSGGCSSPYGRVWLGHYLPPPQGAVEDDWRFVYPDCLARCYTGGLDSEDEEHSGRRYRTHICEIWKEGCQISVGFENGTETNRVRHGFVRYSEGARFGLPSLALRNPAGKAAFTKAQAGPAIRKTSSKRRDTSQGGGETRG